MRKPKKTEVKVSRPSRKRAPAKAATPPAPAPSAHPEVQPQVQRATGTAPPKQTPKSVKTRKRRGTNLLPPGDPVQACRAGSKQAILVDMLSRKDGATMAELLEALSGGRKPWVQATVRSGFGWDLKNKGYGVRSRFATDGTERFSLLLPAGEQVPRHLAASDGPLAREGRAPKAKAAAPARRSPAAPQVSASRRA